VRSEGAVHLGRHVGGFVQNKEGAVQVVTDETGARNAQRGNGQASVSTVLTEGSYRPKRSTQNLHGSNQPNRGYNSDNKDGQVPTQIEFLGPEFTPEIPASISVDEFERYFHIAELSDLYSIETSIDTITLILTNGEQDLNTVKIPYRLIAPETNGIRFPRFLLNISKFSPTKVDYKSQRAIFNQNELLWIVIYHRLQQFAIYKRAFAYLLTRDIQNIVDYADYNMYSSYNAIQKAKNSYAVLDAFKKTGNSSWVEYEVNGVDTVDYKCVVPIGEKIGRPKLDAPILQGLFRDLDILPGSESMASETGKFVINSSEEIYRCAGFKLDQIHKIIKTIFPIKPNIPARFKSHVASDSFKIEKYDRPIFVEDVLPGYEDGTDQTLLNALVVFMPIEESGRFLCGEVEASGRFARNEVIKREIVKAQFSTLSVKTGDKLNCIGGRYLLGRNELGKEVTLEGFDSVEIISCDMIGVPADISQAGNHKIVAKCVKKIGSSRMISTTGLKAVTKPKYEIGTVYAKNAHGHEVAMSVDLIVGPNSMKAKENTIYLAQAALAHVLGYSNPDKQYISSLDEAEINTLVKSLGVVEYQPPDVIQMVDGVAVHVPQGRVKAYAGIVPTKVTEMSYMYKNAKEQAFMTQSAWYLARNGHKDLAELIYQTDVSPEDREIVTELTKIIYDDCGFYAKTDDLPIYGLHQIKDHFQVSDCKIQTNPMDEYSSRLLDPDNKGFYIYLASRNEYIRMPSAKLILRFTSKIADGTFIYTRLLTVVSQILLTCLIRNQDNGQINTGYILRKDQNRFTPKSIALGNKYIELCLGMLHFKNNYLSTLMVPKVFGCSMKQMVDIHVPLGVVVIIDRKLYERLGERTGGYLEQNNEFWALCVRNPVLWKTQVQAVRVWDYDYFKAWLAFNTNEDVDTYFDESYCKDLILLNPDDAILQEADVDGDLMPMFVPDGRDAQDMMATFKRINDTEHTAVDNVTQTEIDWIKAYRQGEMDSNSLFEFKSPEFKVNEINLRPKAGTDKNFGRYFANSIVAKGDIGIATFHLWSLQCLLDLYQLKAGEGEILDKKGKPCSLSKQHHDLISFGYSRLVQDLVVRGIKYNDSGSAEFKPFLLPNIVLRENRTAAFKTFANSVGIGTEATIKLFEVLGWADVNGLIDKIMAFISLYNSGNHVKYQDNVNAEFEADLRKTFYGSRLDLYYNIRDAIKQAKSEGFNPGPLGAGTKARKPISSRLM